MVLLVSLMIRKLMWLLRNVSFAVVSTFLLFLDPALVITAFVTNTISLDLAPTFTTVLDD